MTGNRLFAVERFDDLGGPRPFDPFPIMPDGVRLACAVYLSGDDVMLALVEGKDESSVRAAVTAAGWRVDRISVADWATPPVTDPIYNELVSGDFDPHRRHAFAAGPALREVM